MFWEIFVKLCNEKNIKPNPLAKELGISSGAITSWKNGGVPRSTALQKIADYFNVSTNYLLGKEATKGIVLSDEEERLVLAYRGQTEEGKKMVRKLLDLDEPTNRVIDDLTSDPITDLQTTVTNAFTKTTT